MAKLTDARPTTAAPVLTVIIPTYRREKQVREAIESALAGGVEAVEVLVVDDSSDASARESVRSVRDTRVRYLTMPEPSRGKPALVRNHALHRARGHYLYFLDDDDLCHPGSLAALVAGLDANPQVGVAFGLVTTAGPVPEVRERYDVWWSWAGRVARQVAFSSWLTAGVIMFRGTMIINSTCMIRRAAALELGGYDPSIPVYEDVDFFLRGIRRFGHVFVEREVLIYGTGLPSIMHDCEFEPELMLTAHRRIYEAYKEQWGSLDFRLLQLTSKLMPITAPPEPEVEERAPREEAIPRHFSALAMRRRPAREVPAGVE